MIYQPAYDQDEDVLMLNPDPETAAFDDDEDDFDEEVEGAEFDELGTGAASGYGADDLDDIEDDFNEEDLDEDLDDDSIEDDLDDDSME
jgi:DNA-directed RNA polymerase subunit delta